MHAELYKSNVMFSTKTTTFYINGQPRILDSFKNSLTLVKKLMHIIETILQTDRFYREWLFYIKELIKRVINSI